MKDSIKNNFGNFEDITDQITGIVTGRYPNGVLRISKKIPVQFGCVDRKMFEDEILSEIYKIVESQTDLDITIIQTKMHNKILFV
jgi:hypothetical protein